jgi:hypothetical protein
MFITYMPRLLPRGPKLLVGVADIRHMNTPIGSTERNVYDCWSTSRMCLSSRTQFVYARFVTNPKQFEYVCDCCDAKLLTVRTVRINFRRPGCLRSLRRPCRPPAGDEPLADERRTSHDSIRAYRVSPGSRDTPVRTTPPTTGERRSL